MKMNAEGNAFCRKPAVKTAIYAIAALTFAQLALQQYGEYCRRVTSVVTIDAAVEAGVAQKFIAALDKLNQEK